jgi:hypothetical protein
LHMGVRTALVLAVFVLLSVLAVFLRTHPHSHTGMSHAWVSHTHAWVSSHSVHGTCCHHTARHACCHTHCCGRCTRMPRHGHSRATWVTWHRHSRAARVARDRHSWTWHTWVHSRHSWTWHSWVHPWHPRCTWITRHRHPRTSWESGAWHTWVPRTWRHAWHSRMRVTRSRRSVSRRIGSRGSRMTGCCRASGVTSSQQREQFTEVYIPPGAPG